MSKSTKEIIGPADSDDQIVVPVESLEGVEGDMYLIEPGTSMEPGEAVNADVIDLQAGCVQQDVLKVVGTASRSASKVTDRKAYADSWERIFGGKQNPELN